MECHLAQSGYAANVGLMHAICTPEVPVYVDHLLHMSFYDGLAARRVCIYTSPPNDTIALEANICKYGPGVICVESVYSTTGTIAPLIEIVRIKQEHGCVLVVDESHSLGIVGAEGRGCVNALHLLDGVDFVTASLAKAFATRAGVVFGRHSTDFVRENSLVYIFSSALMHNDIVRIRAVWDIIRTADHRRDQLLQATRQLRSSLATVAPLIPVQEVSSPDGVIMASALICLRTRDEEEMTQLHQHLSAHGILAAPFFAPTTSRKQPIVRLTVHSHITPEDIAKVVSFVAEFYGKRLVARL